MEGLDWNDGKRQTENGIKYQKKSKLGRHFFYWICSDADVMTSQGTVIFAGKAYLKINL